MERPDQLVLKDKQGKLSFDLAAYEFDHVGAMARDPRFKEKVDDSLAGRDCGGFDIGISMQFQLDGAAVVDVPHVDNCALAPERGQPPKILYEVISYLTSLKKKHLDCPPWQIPGGWQSGVDALPQRALCWNCSGECGGDRDAAVTRPQPPTIPTGGTAGDADAGAE